MKIIEDYNKDKSPKRQLLGGEVVFMRGSGGAHNFYGIVVPTVGIIELKHGSSAYANTKGNMYLGDVF